MSIEEAAKSLYKAMKGIGTDEKAIIRVICNYSNAQRQDIKKAYVRMYGKQLEEDLKSEISGNFLEGVLSLLMTPSEYESHCLREAMKGAGTDEKALIHLLCTKDGYQVKQLAQTYKNIFDRDLDKDIDSELSGDLCRLMRAIVSGNRDQSNSVNSELARREAKELFDAGEGRLGTDEIEFIRILCSRSFNQLISTFQAYSMYSINRIEKALKDEMSGNLKSAFLAIIKSAQNVSGYFAEQLHEAMKGLGTDDRTLIRILVSRSEIDLPRIKVEYLRMYGKSLYDVVKSDLSGDYERLFLTLIGYD